MTKIRDAQFDDFEQILALNQALFNNSHSLSPEFNLDWPSGDEAKEIFAKAIVSSTSFLLVAEVEATMVGYIWGTVENLTYRKPSKFAVIVNVFVKEKYRSGGVGKQLVDKFVEESRHLSPQKLRVETGTNNHKAINFYKQLGMDEFSVTLEKSL